MDSSSALRDVKLAAGILLASLATLAPRGATAATYYVRQTVGDDRNDGTSPEHAWRHLTVLSAAMHAGDVAYVGPGLYREEVVVENDGTLEGRITFVGDATGQHTGDPPGTVMVAGSDPLEAAVVFEPHSAPGVYTAQIADKVWGAVEMDGPQFRYQGTQEDPERVLEHLPPVEVVAKHPSSYFYDDDTHVLYLHTSDGRPPRSHEMELIHRGAGVLVQAKHHVTVEGFTFRHMQDAGVSFFRGSANCVAADNVSYGSRQGIRVYGATNVLVYDNTLFRNENSGVYFAAQSVDGEAIGNVAYENVKGVRWSSQSGDGLCLDNALFDNHERGIAIENADRILVRRNRVANNARSQLLVIRSAYSSESNCWGTGGAGQLVAEFFPYFAPDQHATLADYQRARHQDLGSRGGDCGPLPAKVDVARLHARTTAYAEEARRILAGGSTGTAEGGVRRWFGWLL
ncbi:MAG: right-handed parallel beta-helix repeat-containing protein, partial [Acidimicrobiales bacterium]